MRLDKLPPIKAHFAETDGILTADHFCGFIPSGLNCGRSRRNRKMKRRWFFYENYTLQYTPNLYMYLKELLNSSIVIWLLYLLVYNPLLVMKK